MDPICYLVAGTHGSPFVANQVSMKLEPTETKNHSIAAQVWELTWTKHHFAVDETHENFIPIMNDYVFGALNASLGTGPPAWHGHIQHLERQDEPTFVSFFTNKGDLAWNFCFVVTRYDHVTLVLLFLFGNGLLIYIYSSQTEVLRYIKYWREKKIVDISFLRDAS